MKNLNHYLLLPLLLAIVLVGCKKEEIIQNTTVISYTPKDIKGDWLFTDAYDKNSTSMISYPISLDTSYIKLEYKSLLLLRAPCNGGTGKYLFTESGGFQISDFVQTQLSCIGTEGLWEGILMQGIENSYHYELSNNNQTMRIYSTHDYDLIFMKLN